jgi:hypothetical protein
MTFTVNHQAPPAHRAARLLEESARQDVTVASIAHRNAKVDWNNLQGEYDNFRPTLYQSLATYAHLRSGQARRQGQESLPIACIPE